MISLVMLGRCQTVGTRNKVEQLCHSILFRDKVAHLTSQVAQLLTSRTTNLLDRNHLYFSAISRSVAQKTNAGNQKGLLPSMLVPILTTHNSEHHSNI